VLIDGPHEFHCDTIEGFVPVRIAPTDLGVKQSSVSGECVGERRSFRAEASVISGMLWISGERAIRCNAQPTTYPAIRACCADHAACHRNPAADGSSASGVLASSA
jgi:hypothetical protein